VVSEPRRVPASLRGPGIEPLWQRVRLRIDRTGEGAAGTIAMPDLDPAARLAVRSLLGRPPGKRLDLAALEAGLVALGIGGDLDEALDALGHPASVAAIRRRHDRQRRAATRHALRESLAIWPEDWAAEWGDEIWQAGLVSNLEPHEVTAEVAALRRVLDAGGDSVISRTELAAAVFGSAHALDPGTRLAGLATRLLQRRVGPLEGRELWDAAGIPADRVSAPALVWGLPVATTSPLDVAIRSTLAGGLPLHVSLVAIQRYPVVVHTGAPVLIVENPRLVEAAAERGLEACVVAANGNPSTAVTTLMTQLLTSGAELHYHGDFDAAGLAMCRRMIAAGCTAFAMDADDYLAAVRRAHGDGVDLGLDAGTAGPTPWDPALERAFDDRRLVVHEEFVVDDVLRRWAAR
jgi:uncharacterized protein (TIGR02679 family)